jgi:hypothetical protein
LLTVGEDVVQFQMTIALTKMGLCDYLVWLCWIPRKSRVRRNLRTRKKLIAELLKAGKPKKTKKKTGAGDKTEEEEDDK